ncbi:receptor activity-modifying protein 1 [Tachysurus ichikawai]
MSETSGQQGTVSTPHSCKAAIPESYTASLSAVAMACNSYYEDAIKELCLAKFKEDMEALDQGHWCSWEDTVEGAVTGSVNTSVSAVTPRASILPNLSLFLQPCVAPMNLEREKASVMSPSL